MDIAVSHSHSQSEKADAEAEAGAQPTPLRAESLNPDAPETFAHAEPPSSSSFPLLQKLRVDRKWRAKWKGRKQTQQVSEQQRADHHRDQEAGQEEVEGEEDVDDVEANDEGRSMLGRASRSSTSYLSSERNNSGWGAKILRFLPVPMIGFHHILMVISIVGIILLSLLVAGCSSHRMRNIYLLQLSYDHELSNSNLESGGAVTNPSFYTVVANASSTASLDVRVGYFGVCMVNDPEGDSPSWTCRPKAKGLAEQVPENQDPLKILAVADNFRDQVIVSVIIIMSIILMLIGCCGFGTFPGWHEETLNDEIFEVKPFPSQAVSTLILGFYVLATIFLLTAILWQHVAVVAHSATIEAAFNGAVKGGVGTAAMALGWVAIGTNCLVILGLAVMLISIRLLRKLVDDDEDDA